jgi:D-proline reductase (dithiol) PrdB
VGLVANGLEALGISTLVVGTVRDVMEQTHAPRSVFVDFPVGRTFGHPGHAEQHQQVLAAALARATAFSAPGAIDDLPFQWAGADRSWEGMVNAEVTRRNQPPPG